MPDDAQRVMLFEKLHYLTGQCNSNGVDNRWHVENSELLDNIKSAYRKKLPNYKRQVEQAG